MTALFIILAVFAFLVLLMFIPLRIKIDLHFEFSEKPNSIGSIVFCWLFIKKNLSFDKKEKPNTSDHTDTERSSQEPPLKEKNKYKEKLKKILDFFKGKSAKEICDFSKKILLLLKDFLKALLCHVKLYNLNIKTCLVGEDATKTALYYTTAIPLCYSVLSFLKSDPKHFINPDIQIFAGFLAENSQLAVKSAVKIVPFFVLVSSVKYSVRFIKVIKSYC